MGKIFLSYSRASADYVAVLESDLQKLGHDVWYDQELSGGQTWWDQILTQIRDCHAFVFVLDPGSVSSTACRREFTYADRTGAPILPILASGDVNTSLLPSELQKVQFVDYADRNPDATLRLARAMNSLPQRGPLPDPLPDPPEVPVSYITGLAERVRSEADLNVNDQKSLLFDLKEALKDEQEAEGARTLLLEFRKRRDLFAVIAEATEESISALTPAKPEPALEPQAPEPAPQPQRTEPSASRQVPEGQSNRPPGVNQDPKPPTKISQHVWRAVIGFAVGTGIGLGAMTNGGAAWQELLILGLFTGCCGAIYLAVAGANRLAHAVAIIGGIGAFAFAYSIVNSSDALIAGTVFGPSGIAGGAFLGRILEFAIARISRHRA